MIELSWLEDANRQQNHFIQRFSACQTRQKRSIDIDEVEKASRISVLFHFYLLGNVIFWSIKKDIADCSVHKRNGVKEMLADSPKAVHELGDASFYLYDYHFQQDNHNGIFTLQPQKRQGYGSVYQVQPTTGLFLSTGNWTPYVPMERKYTINQPLVKIYYLESGGVTLIQNGKKAQTITEGIHLYLNKPSQGRVLYQPDIPIRYSSVLLFEDYIEKNLQERFTSEDFDYAEIYNWKSFDYNTPEVGTLFLQIRDKLIAGETSRLYYESKVGELLSIVAENFLKQQQATLKQQTFSQQEKKALEAVRQAIEQNILNPPEMSQLCKISAMGRTKLRESFKAMYGVPIGTYIRQAKMRYALLLMSKPNLTIGNIAEHLGYANASKFAAAFRKAYGKSPEEYRNQKR